MPCRFRAVTGSNDNLWARGTPFASGQLINTGPILSSNKTGPTYSNWRALPSEVPSLRNEWMDAMIDINSRISRRTTLAEQIGEYGAMTYARQQKWKPLLTQNDKNIRQGFDQVYQGRRGTIHVIEAKGRKSPLNMGYSHKQGTLEWAYTAHQRYRAGELDWDIAAGKKILAALLTPLIQNDPLSRRN